MIAMTYAQVAELVDAHVSGACVERHAGSSPVLGTILKCGNSSVGRAQPCQGWGREFESRFPLRIKRYFRRVISFLFYISVESVKLLYLCLQVNLNEDENVRYLFFR